MKLLKKIILGCLLLLGSVSHARNEYLFEAIFDQLGRNYLINLGRVNTDVFEELSAEQQTSCRKRYDGLVSDRSLDIKIALGYFDWTSGRIVKYKGGNYGFSPSIDLGAYKALTKLMLSPCRNKAQFCGFRKDSEDDYHFAKTVQIHGIPITAKIELHFSSATEFLNHNLGGYHKEQNIKTNFMNNFFENALRNADATFYFGHSRNGGGPDFSPPVFVRGKNKVNYNGYYEIKQPGFKKLLAAINGESRTKILGLMSCASKLHFFNKIKSVAPEMGVISSKEVITIDEVYTAMVGALDSLLRGQCQSSFYKALRLSPNNAKYITMDNMFL